MPKNLNKVPKIILDHINSFDQDDVVAATVKLIKVADAKLYAHLGVSWGDGGLILPDPRIPDPNAGRFSRANALGMEKKRTDLPKIKKEFGFLAPSWRSGSFHYVSHEREVYVREVYPPKQVELTITKLGEHEGGYLVKFAIDQVINRRTPNFERELLYNLNLLQENVGAADVFKSTSTLEEYAARVRVEWQLLPPGTVDEVIEAILRGKRKPTPEQEAIMRDRVTAMSQLKPEAYITGTDGFLRYFGAKFGDDFVAFENIRYGNALYVMYEDWETLSKKSRIDILSGDPETYLRIEHRKGWMKIFREMVREYRKKKQRDPRLL